MPVQQRLHKRIICGIYLRREQLPSVRLREKQIPGLGYDIVDVTVWGESLVVKVLMVTA